MWYLVITGGTEPIRKAYRTPSLVCEAIIKADYYYRALKEQRTLQIQNETGITFYTCNTTYLN